MKLAKLQGEEEEEGLLRPAVGWEELSFVCGLFLSSLLGGVSCDPGWPETCYVDQASL